MPQKMESGSANTSADSFSVGDVEGIEDFEDLSSEDADLPF